MQAKHLQLHNHHVYTLKMLRDGYRTRVYVDRANNGQATTERQREIDSLNGVGTAAQPLTFAEKITQATAAAPKAKSSLADNMQAALADLPSHVFKTLEAAIKMGPCHLRQPAVPPQK
jgi:hypothetical protein